MPFAVTDWPSGLVMVTLRAPGAALPATLRLTVTCVGSVYCTPLTVMPAPLTDAAMWRGKPAPGSKKPEPLDDVPSITTDTFVAPGAAVAGAQFAGVAGGGARTCSTCTAQSLPANS